MQYSKERKEAVLKKMMPPHNRSVVALAREEGISEDPIGFNGGDTNLMAYVGNNPVNFVDPWGLCQQSKSTTDTSVVKGLTFGLLAAGVVVVESLKIAGIDAAQSLFFGALPAAEPLGTVFDKTYQVQQAMENINTGYEEKAQSISNRIQNIKDWVNSW